MILKRLLRAKVNLSNPALVYSIVWLLALALASMRLTLNLPPFTVSSLVLVLGNIATAWCAYVIVATFFVRLPRVAQVPAVSLKKLTRFTNRLMAIWVVGTMAEIIYGRGFPLLWSVLGRADLNYTNFGVPTFHGLMNSLYFLIITARFFDYLTTGQRKSLWISMALLGWPILMLGRGILLGAVFQMIAIYVTLRRVSISNLVKLTGIGLGLIVLFGFIGDTRGTKNPFSYLVAPSVSVFERLPTGFLWFYVYTTAPLANVVVNIDVVQPTYTPYFSTINLLPSVIRQAVWPEHVAHDSLPLIDSNLNVSTIYEGYLPDFGLAGSILAVALLQIVSTLVYFQAKRKKVWAILAYAVIFQCLVFSIFYDLFLVLVYIFQIVLALFFLRTRTKGNG